MNEDRLHFRDLEPQEPQALEVQHIIIPECCREGWDSCVHVPKQQKKQKTNIALQICYERDNLGP